MTHEITNVSLDPLTNGNEASPLESSKTKRLHIVVPYRDRYEHLLKFVPHVCSYFARDKLDCTIEYQVLFVEQENGLPFNRGALKNIGFALGQGETDYTCFADIDYLPIWADYSWTNVPSTLVWYGAEERPIAPMKSNMVVKHDMEQFVGGSLLVPNDSFLRVNGYSNDYWGWGYEDLDLAERFRVTGTTIHHRKGTFFPLDHDNEGFDISGTSTSIAEVNKSQYFARCAAGIQNFEDGISNVQYQVIDRRPIMIDNAERVARWEIVTVRLTGRPSIEQEQALKLRALT